MARSRRTLIVSAMLAAAFLVVALGTRLAARTQPPAQKAPHDLGPTAAAQTVSASLVLKVNKPQDLEAFVAQTQDPTSKSFHEFESLDDFVKRFAPGHADIDKITKYLDQFGITVTDVYADHLLLKAVGTVDAFNQAFDVDVHDFDDNGKHFHHGVHPPKIPPALADVLVTVVGPSDEARFHPMNRRVAQMLDGHTVPVLAQPAMPGVIATGQPGDFTVGDVANMYNINPLYQAHISGAGRTLGIATLANFIPADAFEYWSLIGLTVDPNRITQVHVDGGGVLSSAAGSGETSLDVEQSGGLAPGAKMVVYDAPNNDVGFIDLFYEAASDNLVDSLSVSWGSAEELYAESVVGVDRTGELLAFHQAFLESAAQGISLFASTGDNGAYDINDGFNDLQGLLSTNILSVDVPAADPAITAAGGTTTPVALRFSGFPASAPNLVVPTESVWGWDYIQNYFVTFRGHAFDNFLFPVGGGGGVSIFWNRPAYQNGTPGIRTSEPGQSIIIDDGSGSGPQDLLDLPAHFAGRNLPDVSLDADPETGFIIVSTSDVPAGNHIEDGFGGTSFVAPQLNGISALLAQVAGGRIGLWNPMLYRFKQQIHGAASPLVDITAGDNWFYNGVPGYEPGAGLGVLNVANLASAVANDSRSDDQNHHPH